MSGAQKWLIFIFSAIGILVVSAVFLLPNLEGSTRAGVLVVPVLILGGILSLIVLLKRVAAAFSTLGLSDKERALGLPDGSIRAIIALSLVVIFAILSVFLYQGISTGRVNILEDMSDDERSAFIKDNPSIKDLEIRRVEATDKKQQVTYNIIYRSSNPTADDFAKQLLVLLGTLMTAVTSFYLGAGTVSSANSANSAKPKPSIASINPKSTQGAAVGSPLKLTILGNNLNSILNVKLVNGDDQVIGTLVTSNPTQVECSFTVTPKLATDSVWDVVIDDGALNSVTASKAFTISASVT